ncbi:MAG: phenylalanine--tRNA ligase subunit beta [Candidatus Babeliales bacterium]
MKLSLAWIFDHIAASMTDYDINDLVHKLALTTAEIDGVTRITFNANNFTLARVTSLTDESVTLTCGQFDTDIVLPRRSDIIEDAVYFVTKEAKATYRWSTLLDFHANKDGLMPAITCSQKEFEGAWQKEIDAHDYILDVDNSSITHRPDLWSHRGFAREIAAILDVSLKSEDHFFAQHHVQEHNGYASSTQGNSFTLEIQDPTRCKSIAGISIPGIGHYASWVWMVSRLCRVDARPIDGIVDATNYVMLDIGQPLHAFDADVVATKQLVVRTAKQGTPLTLLDGQTIELSSDDLVISNGIKPLDLAGIMGGKSSAISHQTRSIIVQGATFEAATIRKSSQRHKLRTEASVRFEKSLDTQLNVLGIQRFIKLFEDQKISLVAASDIISLGKKPAPITIMLTHDYIERMLGVKLASEQIIQILTPLDFTVYSEQLEGKLAYKVIVPSFRATKEFAHPQDIVEEIGRFYGYGNIPLELPLFTMMPSDLTPVDRRRAVTQYLASNLRAHEVKKYPVFDEQFLKQLGYQPDKGAVTIKNPLSDNWYRMVTSLAPHLFHCIQENAVGTTQLRFFEWGRQWHLDQTGNVLERKMLAGIVYDQHNLINFYEIKNQLQQMYKFLGFDVVFNKTKPELPWYHPHQTATLHCGTYIIGMMGIAHPTMLATVAQGHALVFELDGDFITSAKTKEKRYVPLPVYQDSSRDVSFFVPNTVTVAQLEKVVRQADARIFNVALVDYFERPEWGNKRSITLRFSARDAVKTLQKDDIDAIGQAVMRELATLGATVR